MRPCDQVSGSGSGCLLPGSGSGCFLPGSGSGHFVSGSGSGRFLPGSGSGSLVPGSSSGYHQARHNELYNLPELPGRAGTGSGSGRRREERGDASSAARASYRA
ncbi:MAG: hypothetical protein J2P21_24855 [Chloracidobacterium sp.]|nr:hypothetical protein [Chloracidobacterium sp.]